ncbi:hypothetical protein Tco_0167109 [Tanacetum coccineum]
MSSLGEHVASDLVPQLTSCEFLDPKKKLEVESWIENSKNVDLLADSDSEFEEEIEEEEEEDNLEYFDTFPNMEELRYHEWLLKNPRPSWVKAKIRTGNLDNVKVSCMIGTDIAKISRKRSKPDKHGHGNGIECVKAGRMLSKVNKSQLMVNSGQP